MGLRANNLPPLALKRAYSIEFFDIQITNSGSTNATYSELTSSKPKLYFTDDDYQMRFTYSPRLSVNNTAKLILSNIDDDLVSLFQGDVSKTGIIFKAYYLYRGEPQKYTFKGSVFRINQYQEGVNQITDIELMDAITFLFQQCLNLTFPANSKGSDIALACVQQYGQFLSITGQASLSKVYSSPFSTVGKKLDDVLDKLCKDSQCVWKFQGNEIIIANKSPKLSVPAIVDYINLNFNTGLIGNPRASMISAQLFPVDYISDNNMLDDYPVVQATSLMQNIDLFDNINLNVAVTNTPGNPPTSQTNPYAKISGAYIAIAVDYQLDLREGDYIVNLTLFPADAPMG